MASVLLEGLSAAQAEVVTTGAAPLAVVAGPGSGKTRVLTRRVAWRCATGDAEAAHTLVLTFSHRAARELSDRLAALGVAVGARATGVVAGTFHAVALAQLARRAAERGEAPPSVTGRQAPIARPALATVLGRDPWPGETAAFLREIGWARAQAIGPEGYLRAGRSGPLPAEAVVDGWAAYDRAKRHRRVLDLDDLLEACLAMVDESPDVARWRHRHVFVDEYQDLNETHRRLLHGWVGGRPDVCLVGDPDQAIYGFNGASPSLFERVAVDWPGVRVLRLDDNHRSTPEVVAFADAIRPGPARQVGSVAGGRRSPRAPGPLPTVCGYADEQGEAAAVARAIVARRAPGRGWGRVAVLARTNARLLIVAAALDRAGVPWRLRDPRPLADRPAVQHWLASLPPAAPIADAVETLDSLPGPERAALVAAAEEYRGWVRRPCVGGFGDWLDANGVTAPEGAAAGVDLVTFHRAKGLEWDSVWVVGVDEGVVPLRSSGGPDLAEEQRLLYVALTRAADEITVSWAGEPSRWAVPLAATAAALGTAPAPDDQRARLMSLRATVANEDLTGVAARRRALLGWRAARARAAVVAPEVILPDRALSRLAGAGVGPATEADVVRLAGTEARRVARWAPELVRLLTG